MDEFELARTLGGIENRILGVRDELQKILDGEIERGHCSPGTRECYGGKPGKRKLTLADARKIAKHAVFNLSRTADELREIE